MDFLNSTLYLEGLIETSNFAGVLRISRAEILNYSWIELEAACQAGHKEIRCGGGAPSPL